MKHILGTFAVAAALAFAGGIASTPAAAASSKAAKPANGLESNHAVTDTDMSSHRRRWRHRHYVRRFPHVYSYGHYRPRPHYYRPYSYAYYPPPYYYRPYRPQPFFSIGFGFGPRFYW